MNNNLIDDKTEALRAALRALLPDTPNEHFADLRYRALAGGVNQRSFLVELAGGQYVLRLPTSGAASLLDLATEARAMRAAAAAGLAPAVLGVDAPAGLLLTEYRAAAAQWTADAARRTANIPRAAALLRSLHAIDLSLPAYEAERIATGYLTALAVGEPVERDSLGGARVRSWADELVTLARRYDALHSPTAFCHNDLFAANVLDDGALVLVDFEYAVRGSPLLDLAGLAGMNDFSDAQQLDLLAAYYRDAGGSPADVGADPRELARTVRMVRLMAFFWARREGRRVANAAPYLKLTAKLAERLAAQLNETEK
jgi:thiamine kinase-like enzyme